MRNTFEIRWHGRGGQGTVTAAKVFANACMQSGRFVQAFPDYGPERSGAPLQVYNRIGHKELRMHCPVLTPMFVVVVDASLLSLVDIAAGADERAFFLINSAHSTKEIKINIPLKAKQKVFCVDGTGIAIDSFGQPLPNSAMVGALGRISGMVDLDSLTHAVEKSFGKKFSAKVIQGNLDAVARSWEEVARREDKNHSQN